MAAQDVTVEVGQTAPDFRCPGVDRGEFSMYDLHRPIEYGDAVLVVFFPTDFLELPTTALAAMGRHGWTNRGGLTVWGCSADSVFAHRHYAQTYDLEMPLLSDFHAGVARQYGLALDDWEAHGRVPSWAWVLIDSEWVIREVWNDPPTPTWTVPPVADFVDAIEETVNIALEPLELSGP